MVPDSGTVVCLSSFLEKWIQGIAGVMFPLIPDVFYC